jgi:hypothetical protein
MRRLLLLASLLCLCLLWNPLAHAAQVMLAWDYAQGSNPAVGYQIYKQPDCVGPFIIAQTQTVELATWTDTQVVQGARYCVYVTAISRAGEESAPSNTVAFRVPTQLPAAPYNLHIQ